MDPAQAFIPGLELSAIFYQQAVGPIMAAHFPQVTHSAARLDYGSDVLGFDTPRSTDHGWGPRLLLFVGESDYVEYRDAILRTLSQELPYEIAGYSTNFASPERDGGWLVPITSGPITHGVRVWTVRSFFKEHLNIGADADLRAVDWLTISEQRLRTVASGRVFYDGLGTLEPIRARLRYYPHDVWLYLLAAQWRKISQEEAFMARCGEAGDELGSRILAARLARELMRLCFLMERTYAPYSKWFGTAFAQLRCAATLGPILESAIRADAWQAHEAHLTRAYEFAATMHNQLGITAPLPAQVSPFHDRPYLVIHSDAFAEAIRAAITDAEVLRLPPYIGSITQFVDSTDVLEYYDYFERLKVLYQ